MADLGRLTPGTSWIIGAFAGGYGCLLASKVAVGAQVLRVASASAYLQLAGPVGTPETTYNGGGIPSYRYHRPSFKMRAVIYSDTGGGRPYQVVGVSDEIDTATGVVDPPGWVYAWDNTPWGRTAWIDFTFSATVDLRPGRTYHIGILHNATGSGAGGLCDISAASAAGKAAFAQAQGFTMTPQDPFGTPYASLTDTELSVYVSGAEVDPTPAHTITITFDGVAATGIVYNAATHEITCVPPAHAPGVVNVVVTFDGTESTGTYTYDAPTGTGGGAAAVTFDGIDATEITMVDADTFQCRTPAHAPGAVDVVVNFDDGEGNITGPNAYLYDSDAPPPAGGTKPQGGIVT